MDKKRHKLLERQLKALLPLLAGLPSDVNKALNHFFDQVDSSYQSNDDDRELLEHSMEISSEELFHANEDLRKRNHSLQELLTAQRQAEETIRKQQLQIQNSAVESAHKAGMSEIATGILHNVGNVLNSANVGLETIQKKLENSVVSKLFKANELLAENRHRLAEFFTSDPKGEKLINFYFELGEAIKGELNDQKSETSELMKKIQLIKDIINTQQTYAKGVSEFKEDVNLADIVDSALSMEASSLIRHEIKVVKTYPKIRPISVQKAKLIHIILNLIKNAKEAMALGGKGKTLTIEFGDVKGSVFLKISDTGVGIEEKHISKIFNHGFTTKVHGHGFGLHYCANSINEMGGKITVFSPGANCGAEFTIHFNDQNEDKKVA